MRIAVVGSRGFPSRSLVELFVTSLPEDTVLVSGGAKGVDTWGEKAARKRSLQVAIHLPDYQRHGKAAPFVRNNVIANDCDQLYAFWDGESNGTRHVIKAASGAGKNVVLFMPEASEAEVELAARSLGREQTPRSDQ